MNVLVTFESKYGATEEIARRIGTVLEAGGHAVTVADAQHAPPVVDFEAVVAGSAVYAGHWLGHAKTLIENQTADLQKRPVWLFSSGPIGDPPKPADDPVDVRGLMEASGAREHRLFPGKLDKRHLNFAERAISMALRAPEGDFRNWPEIESWARSIAAALKPVGATL